MKLTTPFIYTNKVYIFIVLYVFPLIFQEKGSLNNNTHSIIVCFASASAQFQYGIPEILSTDHKTTLESSNTEYEAPLENKTPSKTQIYQSHTKRPAFNTKYASMLGGLALTMILGYSFSKNMAFRVKYNMDIKKLKAVLEEMRKELYLWEKLYDENLTPEKYFTVRQDFNRKYPEAWRETLSTGESQKFIKKDKDPKVEARKQELWQKYMVPFLLDSDLPTVQRSRYLFELVKIALYNRGYYNDQAFNNYNLYSGEPFTFDKEALKNHIEEGMKNNTLPAAHIARAKFFLQHAERLVELRNKYVTLRENAYGYIKKYHQELVLLNVNGTE